MPLYEYENPVTGERVEEVRPVEQRDNAPKGFRRVTIPRRVYAHRGCPDLKDVDYATPLAFKDMERKGVSTREMEMAAGMSTEKIKQTFKSEINRLWVILALLTLFWLVGPVRGADITPGYTFVSGETVTHTKLNNAASGSIGTSFFTGQTANTAPTNTAVVLIYDPVAAAFRKSTLSQAFFDSVHLIGQRTTNTATTDDWILFYDTTGGLNYRSSVQGLLVPLFTSQTLTTNVAQSNQVLLTDGSTFFRTGISNLVTNVQPAMIVLTNAPAHTNLTNADGWLVWDSVTGTNKFLTAVGAFTNWSEGTNVAGSDTVVITRGGIPREVAASNVLTYVKSNVVTTFTGTNHIYGAAQSFTNAHGLGVVPMTFEWRLVCVTNDATTGYNVGEELPVIQSFVSGGAYVAASQWADATNVYVRIPASVVPQVISRAGAAASLTTNCWRLKPYAVRFP